MIRRKQLLFQLGWCWTSIIETLLLVATKNVNAFTISPSLMFQTSLMKQQQHHHYTTTVPSIVIVQMASSSDIEKSDPLRRRNAILESKLKKKQTLYDILGAKPTDSPEELRKRYRALVKEIHPDARYGRSSGDNISATFTEINEAWAILNNPKEKKKYDRSLQVKQIGNFMGAIMDVAVPVMKKTAESTIAAVDKSIPVAQDVGQKVGSATEKFGEDVGMKVGTAMDRFEVDVILARDRFAIETKCRELEQKATREERRAKELKNQLLNLPNTKKEVLQFTRSNNSDEKEALTSVESTKILESFAVIETKINASPSSTNVIVNDIEGLTKAEEGYKLKLKNEQLVRKQSQLATRDLQAAIESEQLASQRLMEAQAELEAAQEYVNTCRSYQSESNQAERSVVTEVSRSRTLMNQKMEKVRSDLRKREESTLKKEGAYLQDEGYKVEKNYKQLKRDIQELEERVDELKNEQKNKKK